MRCEVVGCQEESTFTVVHRGKEVIVVLEPNGSDDTITLCDAHYTRLKEWGLELPIRQKADDPAPRPLKR